MDEDFGYEEAEPSIDDGMDGNLAFPELAEQEAIDDMRMAEVERQEAEQLRAAGLTVDPRTGTYVDIDQRLRRRGWR